MSNLQRILNMASKALEKKKGESPQNGSGKTDWRDIVRTAADKVTGDDRAPANVEPRRSAGSAGSTAASQAGSTAPSQAGSSAPSRAGSTAPSQAVSAEDRAAIARYDYLLKTAPPEQLEQVHRDAFERLTPVQRDQVGAQLRAELPVGEQPMSSNPVDLARSATRGEAHNPGFLRKVFAKPSGRGAAGALAGAGIGAAAGVGLGAAGGLLAAVAGGAVLSSVAAPLLEQAAGLGVDFERLAGGLEGVTGGLEGVTGGLEGVADGAGEHVAGLGEQVSDFGSNFEIPGLSDLGNLFRRE